MALTDKEQHQLLDRATNASVMAQAASVRTQRLEAALKALAAGIGPTVQAAVDEALADNVVIQGDVTVTPKES